MAMCWYVHVGAWLSGCLAVGVSRACRWITDAPACAAATDWATMSSIVNGRCGDMVGVWPDPVTAQVMMTLREADTRTP